MLRDYYGRAPPSFFDCCNAATGRSLMYTSVARLGIDSAARARRKLLASVFRRLTEGFDRCTVDSDAFCLLRSRHVDIASREADTSSVGPDKPQEVSCEATQVWGPDAGL